MSRAGAPFALKASLTSRVSLEPTTEPRHLSFSLVVAVSTPRRFSIFVLAFDRQVSEAESLVSPAASSTRSARSPAIELGSGRSLTFLPLRV
jgi:hypothetical protein